MEAWKLLFGSDIGLLSVVTIVIATAFVVYMVIYANKKMDEDAKNAAKK
jgi:hypothetical protein